MIIDKVQKDESENGQKEKEESMKKEIIVFDYAEEILKAVKNGVLVTTKANDRVNALTISWGMLGIQWGVPIFITFIRESRFSKTLLDMNGEFTVNIPSTDFNHDIITVCGSESGKDVDKIKKLGLTLVESDTISVPGILEMPITLECKVVYSQPQDRRTIEPQFIDQYYQGLTPVDYHTAYYGEIKKAYIIE